MNKKKDKSSFVPHYGIKCLYSVKLEFSGFLLKSDTLEEKKKNRHKRKKT